jgi:type VI secretion system protein ImpJ
MLLAPQHFQQQDLHHQQFALYHVMAAAPFHWGVARLTIDQSALVSGLFRVLDLEVVMPDGLIVRCPVDDSDEQLEIDVSATVDTVGETPLTVYLTVPAAKPGGREAPGDLRRFRVVEGPEVADAVTGGDDLQVPRLRPRLGLAVMANPGQRPPQKFVSLPLGRVVYRNEAFLLDDFMPPTLRVAARSPLGRMVGDLCRRIREKALYLMDRAGAISAAGSHPMVQESVAEVRSLVTGLPPVEALLATGTAHPFTLYLGLCGMVGHMAAFASGGAPPVLSTYDHDDAMIAFSEANDYMGRMLDRVKETYVGLPFGFENGKFSLDLPETATEGERLVIGVRGPATMSVSDIAEWMDRSLLASSRRIDTLWEMRVVGARRRPIEPEDGLDITPTRGTVLFVVENDPQFIVPADALEIWNPDNRGARHRPSEIVLYVQAADRAAADA